jgi:hypothetical protein
MLTSARPLTESASISTSTAPTSRATVSASADSACAESGRWSASANCARITDTQAAATLGGCPSTSSAARSTQPDASAGPRNAYASKQSWIASRAAVAASPRDRARR